MTTHDNRVLGTLSELAGLVRSDSDLQNTADNVVALAQRNLECDYAGIILRRSRSKVESLAVTDSVVEQGDQLQYRLGEGPCVDAVWEQQDFAAEDIGADARWPQWGPAASQLGLQSLLAVRLTTSEETVGALNLYSSRPRRFTNDEVAFAHVFAHHAAAALSSARRAEQLTVAIDGRTLIGQAQGILMERFNLTPDQAFAVLSRYSQDNNLKLSAIADELVTTGRLHGEGAEDPR